MNSVGLNYTNLDEASIKAKLVEYLENTTGWAGLTDDHTLNIINDTMSGVASFLIYLIERRAEEVYPDTARTLAAVMKIARSLGYVPKRKISSVTRLRFKLSDSVVTETEEAAEVIDAGDGIETEFSGIVNNYPVKRNSVKIYYTIGAMVYTAIDDGEGSIGGEEITSGTIDYSTGDWSFVFENSIDDTVNIVMDYTWSLSSVLESIIFPIYTSVSTVDGTKFITKEAVTIPVGQIEVDVDAIQGILHTETFTATGEKNQFFFFEVENPEENLVNVLVNDVEWEVRPTLIYSDIDSIHVQVEVSNEYAGLNFFFGDNLLGVIPENNAEVKMQVLESKGLASNISLLDVVTVIDDTILDGANNEFSDIEVTNVVFATGGDNEESIAEIRRNSSRLYRIGERTLTSRQDYYDWVSAYPGVLRTNPWGEYDESPDSAKIKLANIVNIPILTTDGMSMTESYKNQFLSQISILQEINTKIVLLDVEIVKVISSLEVFSPKTKDINVVKNNVDTAVGEYISYKTLEVSQALRISDFTTLVDSVDGVEYHYNKLEIYDKNIDGDGSSLNFEGETIVPKLKAGTVRVINLDETGVKTDIGIDDGAGNFTGSGIASGTIDYVTGEYVLNLTSSLGLNDWIVFRFEQNIPTRDNKSSGDLECGSSQIFDLEDNEMVVNTL